MRSFEYSILRRTSNELWFVFNISANIVRGFQNTVTQLHIHYAFLLLPPLLPFTKDTITYDVIRMARWEPVDMWCGKNPKPKHWIFSLYSSFHHLDIVFTSDFFCVCVLSVCECLAWYLLFGVSDNRLLVTAIHSHFPTAYTRKASAWSK